MSKPVFTNVHINTICRGDTVEHEGRVVTVGSEDIKPNTFMGTTLFGDSYALGTKPVKKATRWTK